MAFGYEIYFTERAKNRIVRWEPDSGSADVIAGEPPQAEQDQTLNSPYGLAFDGTGTLHIADKLNHRICRLRNGRLEPVVLDDVQGSRAPRPESRHDYDPAVRCPTGLFLEEGGSLLCTFADDHTIYRIHSDGRLEHLLGIPPNRSHIASGMREVVSPPEIGDTPLRAPTGIVKRRDGTMFFIERLQQVIRSYHPSSGLSYLFPLPKREALRHQHTAPDRSALGDYHPVFPGALAVDGDDALYMTEATQGCVLRIDLAAGKIRKVIDVHRPQNRWGDGVAAIAFGPDGTAWILNTVVGAVEAYAPTPQGLWQDLGVRITQIGGKDLQLPMAGSGMAIGN